MPDKEKKNRDGSFQDEGSTKERTAKMGSKWHIAGKHGTGPKESPPLVKTSRKPPGGLPERSRKV